MSSDDVTTTEDSDTKKSSKPVMEKRRRARINASLAELKSLLMGVMKSEGCRHNKMEKADVLEMTVRHLRNLQACSRTDRAQGIDHIKESKFQLGYTECINEVGRFLNSLNIEEVDLKVKVIEHLAGCASGSTVDDTEDNMAVSSTTPVFPQIAVSAESKHSGVVSINPRFSAIEPECVLVNNIETQLQSTQLTAMRDVPIRSNDSSLENIPAVSISPHMALPGSEVTTETKPDDTTASRIISPTSRENMCRAQTRPGSIAQKPLHSVRTLYNAAASPETAAPSQITLVPTHAPFSNPTTIFSGLQLVPAQLPNGTIAFMIPTTFSSPTAIVTPPTPSGLVVPVYAPQTISASPSKIESPIQTYKEMPTKVSDTTECSDEASSSPRTTSAFSAVSPTRSDLSGVCITGKYAYLRHSSGNTCASPPRTTVRQNDTTTDADNRTGILDMTPFRSVESSAGKASKLHSKLGRVLDTHGNRGKTGTLPFVSNATRDIMHKRETNVNLDIHKHESSVDGEEERHDIHGRYVVGAHRTSSVNERLHLPPPDTGQNAWRPW